MTHAKNKVKWCLNKAEKEVAAGGKHRGLVKVDPDIKKAREHISKAEHNLKTTLYLQKGDYTDWCSSTIFYSIYHSFLAILAKFGYESRNQECTLSAIESLIEDGIIPITKNEMEKISLFDVEEKHSSSTAVQIREEFQYGTKLSLEDKSLEELFTLASRILDKAKVVIEK